MQGGRRSGKTWSILQYLIIQSIRDTIRVLIVTDTFARLRNSLIQDLERINASMGGYYRMTGGTSPRVRFSNGSTWDFVCSDRNTKGYSSEFRYIFFNEAIQYGWNVARDLFKAGGDDCMILCDYNPYTRFWVNEHLESPTNKLVTTYRDNPFLSRFVMSHLREQEELGKNAPRGSMERYLYEVECMGMDSTLTGRVFPRASTITTDEWEAASGDIYIGMDWGFTHHHGDPDACGAFKFNGDRIYCLELFYSNSADDKQLASTLSSFASSHPTDKPVSVAYDYATNGEERMRGIVGCGAPRGWRYVAARKQHITTDLRNMASVTLFIERMSVHMMDEQKLYTWVDDEGVLKPVDRHNHLMDCMRYAYNQYRSEHPVVI